MLSLHFVFLHSLNPNTCMSRPYDSVVVAKYLRAIAYAQDIILNVTKTQKLLYVIHGYSLAEKGESIIKEKPQAWPYGPVFPRARNKVNYEVVYSLEDPSIQEILRDDYATNLIQFVLASFNSWTASALSEWSHLPDSPWDKVVRSNENWGTPIPDEYIKEYFQELLGTES